MINSSSPEERAAAYALDILEEYEEFERELATSESLRAELADFQSAVSDLRHQRKIPSEARPGGQYRRPPAVWPIG